LYLNVKQLNCDSFELYLDVLCPIFLLEFS
jgi:hypothetical protein